MSSHGIETVAVIGGGTMGSGIAEVALLAGYGVALWDSSADALEAARGRIAKGLSRAGAGEEAMGRLRLGGDEWPEAEEVDLFIEAVPEIVELKRTVFSRLNAVAHATAIMATNTSGIPVSLIASVASHPERVIGTHFMNPVPRMKGVEIVRGLATADETVEATRSFVESLGKVPGVVRDGAGFVTTRLFLAYMNEAALAIGEGQSPEDVDALMVHCVNMPSGPCSIMDLVGLDVVVDGLRVLEDEYGDRFKAAPLLKQMLRAGRLGKKSGRGFYSYSDPS